MLEPHAPWGLSAPPLVSASLEVTGDIAPLSEDRGLSDQALPRLTCTDRIRARSSLSPQLVPCPPQPLHPPPREEGHPWPREQMRGEERMEKGEKKEVQRQAEKGEIQQAQITDEPK